MLKDMLEFFQGELTRHFKLIGLASPNITFPKDDAQQQESISFDNDSLNLMVINLEEENTLRQSEAFRMEKQQGTFPVLPEIRLNAYLLFIANRSNYLTSVDMLSQVIRYFQARRVFDSRTVAKMPEGIDKLTVELNTLSLAEQNEIWNALRISYKPYLLYKVRMLVFSPPEPFISSIPITETHIETSA